MSASLGLDRDRAGNPLDVLEQIVTANEWAFDRRSEAEMAAEAPGSGATTGCTSPGHPRSAPCTSPAPST
jgi:hypothetical protein